MGKFWQASFLAVAGLAACNDSTPLRSASEAAAENAQQQELNEYRKPDDGASAAKPAATSEAGAASDQGDDDAANADPSKFDRKEAKKVLDRAHRKAVQCPAAAHDSKIVGEADIEVDFDGPSGRIVDVKLSAPFTGGSRDGQECLRNAFIGEIIPSFTGTKALAYTLKVPPPADDGSKKPGKKKK